MKCIGTAKTDGDLFSLTFSSEPPYRFGPGRIWNLSAPGPYIHRKSLHSTDIFPEFPHFPLYLYTTCSIWRYLYLPIMYTLFMCVDPDPYWNRIQPICGSVFGMRIHIHTGKKKIDAKDWRQQFTIQNQKLNWQKMSSGAMIVLQFFQSFL